MGKYSILLVTATLILSAATVAYAHTNQDETNNYGWKQTNKDGSARQYDNPDCEKDQFSHGDRVNTGLRNSTARTCEGEHWHGNSSYVSGNSCKLHETDAARADASSWCVAASPSKSAGGWKEGANGPLDVASSGTFGASGAKAVVGVGILWTGETAVGVDASRSKVAAAWYGEDETDKNPVVSPVCKAVYQLDNHRTGPGVNNCLAYWFEIAGITYGQIGDPAEGSTTDCSFEEYNSHQHTGNTNNYSRHCYRDHTSIGATVYLP